MKKLVSLIGIGAVSLSLAICPAFAQQTPSSPSAPPAVQQKTDSGQVAPSVKTEPGVKTEKPATDVKTTAPAKPSTDAKASGAVSARPDGKSSKAVPAKPAVPEQSSAVNRTKSVKTAKALHHHKFASHKKMRHAAVKDADKKEQGKVPAEKSVKKTELKPSTEKARDNRTETTKPAAK